MQRRHFLLSGLAFLIPAPMLEPYDIHTVNFYSGTNNGSIILMCKRGEPTKVYKNLKGQCSLEFMKYIHKMPYEKLLSYRSGNCFSINGVDFKC